MKSIILICLIGGLFLYGCNNQGNNSSHQHGHDDTHEAGDHDHDHDHDHDQETKALQDHEHAAAEESEDEHEHGEARIHITAYSNAFELFAEADPFVAGEPSHVLAHFSTLPGFDPLTGAAVTLKMAVQETVVSKTAENPVRPGIYEFEIVPETSGRGEIVFQVERDDSTFAIHAENITVYADEHEAFHSAEEMTETAGQNIVFTKEQSWKIDFATTPVTAEPFGQIIKTTALVQPAPEDEMLLSAKTSGIVQFISNSTVEGQHVTRGQVLFIVSGSGLADNNLKVRLAEAQNNFEQARANYERAQRLAEDRIISEKELLEAKNRYENTKALFESLNQNFGTDGQEVVSPLNGYIHELFVQNGQFVETGQPLAGISQNKTLLLHADLQPKYASILHNIGSATIQKSEESETYTLDELNGRVLSVGKSAGNNNYLIPVSLLIENRAEFVPGSFVELYLQVESDEPVVTVPNSALLEEQGNYFVMVQVTPELFERREIITGPTNGSRTAVKRGVTPGERVVSQGAVIIKLAQGSGTLDAHSGHVH